MPVPGVHEDVEERTKQENQIGQKFQCMLPVFHDQKIAQTGNDRAHHTQVERQATPFVFFQRVTSDQVYQDQSPESDPCCDGQGANARK
jgi:hypothetical protein